MPILSRRAASTEPAPLPYDPGSDQWLAARWVRWAASAGMMTNALEDRTGEDAGRGQPEDVWFAAGATTSKPLVRRCPAPAGRPIFVPAVNCWVDDGPGVPVLPRAEGEILVDGTAVALREIGTPVAFEVRGARLNPVTNTRSPELIKVWGLWARIDPLPPGPHTVHVRGSDGESFRIDVRYELAVA